MSSKNIVKKKELLYETSDRYKKAIKYDIDVLKSNTRKWGKNALLIGGALFAGYSLFKIFFNSDLPAKGLRQAVDREDKSTRDNDTLAINPSADPIKIIPEERTGDNKSIIVRMITEQVTEFLLNIAKKKLIKFLEELQTKKSQ